MRGRRLEKTGSVFAEYVEDCYGPRTRQMKEDHSSQQNGMTRTDSYRRQNPVMTAPAPHKFTPAVRASLQGIFRH